MNPTDLQEKLKEILSYLGKSEPKYWEAHTDTAVTEVLSLLRETVRGAVPERNVPHTMASENSDDYITFADGFNSCIDLLTTNLKAVGL